ncbi:MAG: tyrosine-type recombinase/integrase [Thermoplasmata archaeon]
MTLPTSASKGNSTPPGAGPSPPTGCRIPHPRASRKGATSAAEHSGQFALTGQEVELLLARVTSVRDRALLSIAIATGIRREDLVAIPLAGYDRSRATIQFHESKKRRVRNVTLDPKADIALQTYLGARARDSQWIFPSDQRFSKPRGHLSGRAAYNILQHWLAVAGLPRRPFHSLRATCYKLAKARGWSLELAAAQLGDTIRVAQEFYGVATPGELSEAMREKPLL